MLRIIITIHHCAWLLTLWHAGGWHKLVALAFLAALHLAAKVDDLYPDWVKRWF